MLQKVFLTIDAYQISLDGSAECNDLIATHATTQEIASHLDYSMLLVFENARLTKAYNFGKQSENRLRELPLPIGAEKVEFPGETVQLPLNIRFSGKGSPSYLGGYKPNELNIPKAGAVSFQYLGFLSSQAEIFKGQGFDLDILHPIYSDVEKVFLDYSDPMNPQILNLSEVEHATTAHGAYINRLSQLDYLKQEIEFYLPNSPGKYGSFSGSSLAGIPHWIQSPYIPHCPKSGKRMHFLMQIGSQSAAQIPVRYSNVQSLGMIETESIGRNGHIDVSYQSRPEEEYYKKMNFWGDGTLYLFFEPETKVVCSFIQNS